MDDKELSALRRNTQSAARVLRCDAGRVVSAKFQVTSGPRIYGAFFDHLRGLCMFEPCPGRYQGRAWRISGNAGEILITIEHDDGIELLYCRTAIHELAGLLPMVVGAWRTAAVRQHGPRPMPVESRHLLNGKQPVVEAVEIEQLLRNVYTDAIEAKGADLLGARIGRIEQLTQTLTARIHALEAALTAAKAKAAPPAKAKTKVKKAVKKAAKKTTAKKKKKKKAVAKKAPSRTAKKQTTKTVSKKKTTARKKRGSK